MDEWIGIDIRDLPQRKFLWGLARITPGRFFQSFIIDIDLCISAYLYNLWDEYLVNSRRAKSWKRQ